MKLVRLKELKKGDFFTLKPIELPCSNQVYVRGGYDKSTKDYSCTKYNDTCVERFLKGDRLVYVGFTF